MILFSEKFSCGETSKSHHGRHFDGVYVEVLETKALFDSITISTTQELSDEWI